MYGFKKTLVVIWVMLAVLNSIFFDYKSIVIWFAALTIALMQTEIIMRDRAMRYVQAYRNKQR